MFNRNRGGVSRIVRDDYTEDWKEICLQVLKRDRYCCTVCGISIKGSPQHAVHHIVPISRGGRTVLFNLTTLCDLHHDTKHRHMTKKSDGARKKIVTNIPWKPSRLTKW